MDAEVKAESRASENDDGGEDDLAKILRLVDEQRICRGQHDQEEADRSQKDREPSR